MRCYCFAPAVATLSMPSQRILSAPVLNRRFKTSAQPIQARKDGVMQNGSLSREQRKRSSDVWCYRWWESGPTSRRIHRRIILGTVEQLHDQRAANQNDSTVYPPAGWTRLPPSVAQIGRAHD